MNYILDICKIVSGIAPTIAVIISIIIYIHGLNRERRQLTLKVLSEIRRNYFNIAHADYKTKLKYLNELEYLAIGIRKKIYDIEIVYNMSGRRLIGQYDKWAGSFIQQRKDEHPEKNKIYSDYEEMIMSLRKITFINETSNDMLQKGATKRDK